MHPTGSKRSPWEEMARIIFGFEGSSSKCTSSRSDQPLALRW